MAQKTLDREAAEGFRTSFRGEVTLPDDPGYDAARAVWNGMIDRHPALVARCTGVADVMAAIRFAREHDLELAVRCGGHSMGGFSTTEGGLLLDLGGLRGVRVDPEARTARVAGGSLLRDLDHEAQAFGLATPVGVVGHTGVGGLTLGGGMGRLQRRYGFTVDNLLSVDLVTADSSLVHVSEEENPDLFWGIRGAGPNFGVVTSFEFRCHRVGPGVVQGWLTYPIDRAQEIVPLFRELASSAPQEMFLSIQFAMSGPDEPPEIAGRPVVILGAAHSGRAEDAERDLRPLRETRPLKEEILPKTYLEMQGANDETFAWGRRVYTKGGYLDGLSDELVGTVISQIERARGEVNIGLWAQGGAVARVPDDAMAFTGHTAAFWIGAEATWDDAARDEEFVGWGRSAWDAVKPFTAAGAYVNDLVEASEAIARSAYGDAKYDRLVALKRKYDPDNIFRLNQNVKP
jgi:FAD/FMN-containing dehydrogenase